MSRVSLRSVTKAPPNLGPAYSFRPEFLPEFSAKPLVWAFYSERGTPVLCVLRSVSKFSSMGPGSHRERETTGCEPWVPPRSTFIGSPNNIHHSTEMLRVHGNKLTDPRGLLTMPRGRVLRKIPPVLGCGTVLIALRVLLPTCVRTVSFCESQRLGVS